MDYTSEMKLPGKAWLEFKIRDEDNRKKLSVTPFQSTKTLLGKVYCYIFLPFNVILFNDLITQIEKRSCSVHRFSIVPGTLQVVRCIFQCVDVIVRGNT